MANDRQITGNIGVYHVARELSRFRWNVMLTVRNARGADLYAVSQCEMIVHPIQVKAHSARPNDTRLGLTPETLVTPWWVFVSHALSEDPICHLVSLDEIRSRMTRDPGARSGKPEHERAFWFDRRYYEAGSDRELVDAREGWARLGDPRNIESMQDWADTTHDLGAKVAPAMHAPLIFNNDDAGFISWRDSHCDGFVLNLPISYARDGRDFNLQHTKLHNAACPFIRGDRNGEKPWTSAGYFKVCADDAGVIESWLSAHATTPHGWQISRCRSCGGDWR